jgi:dihydropteroate synthase
VTLRLRNATLELEPGRPLLMGVLNGAPDSFSDPGPRRPAELLAEGRRLAHDGAGLIDVGGESGRTDRPAVSEGEEIRRVAPVIERLASDGLLVSVDTWRAPVARVALEAGAAMVNDPSGLSDPAVADACAEAGAALVVTHTRVPPKRKGFPVYCDAVEDVLALWRERAAEAQRRGVVKEQLVLDPGIDLAKTPAESVETLRRLPELRAPGLPVLVAVSRKDFVGALSGRMPRERLAGTLAAAGFAAELGASILRVHDVAETRDYLRVQAALHGELAVRPDLQLDEHLRREPDVAA